MKISVVIPTIGRRKYLKLAIKSLLNQTVDFDEIIVFDNSKEQRISYKVNANHFSIIRSGTQLDPISSWNNAVQHCKYDFVVILGDDDVADKNFCYEIKKSLKISDIVIAKSRTIDEHGYSCYELPYPKKLVLNYQEFFDCRYRRECSLFVPGIAFKKSIFMKVGGFKNTSVEGSAFSDELLLFTMCLYSEYVAITENICWNYRIHSDQLEGVKAIHNLMNNSMSYLNIFEKELSSINESNNNSIYGSYGKMNYLEKIVLYKIKLYSTYASQNMSFFKFQYCVIINLYSKTLLAFKSRIYIHYISIKYYFRNKKIAKILKQSS